MSQGKLRHLDTGRPPSLGPRQFISMGKRRSQEGGATRASAYQQAMECEQGFL